MGHWLADVHSAVFAPANRQMPIASVVSGHAKKRKQSYYDTQPSIV